MFPYESQYLSPTSVFPCEAAVLEHYFIYCPYLLRCPGEVVSCRAHFLVSVIRTHPELPKMLAPNTNWVWWYTLAIPALWRWRPQGQTFKVILSYLLNLKHYLKQTNNSQNKNRQIYYLGLKFSIYSLVIMSNRASVSSSVIHLHPGQIYWFGQWQSFNHNLDTPFKRFCHSICCSPQPTGQNLCKNHSWLLPVLDPTPNSTHVIELTLPSPHLTGLPRAPSCWQWPKLSFLMFISFTLTPS